MYKSKGKFDANKTKVNLKMLTNRFQLLTQKKANLAKQQKRQVAMLLRDDKEQNARILVEHIIREDYTLESYDMLRQYTEMLLARLAVVANEPELKPEVAEAVCSLLYAGWLYGNEIPELKVLHSQFAARYGLSYAQEVIEHKEKYLNHRLVRMLTSTQVPDSSVIELYLTEIAKAYNVEFTPRPPPGAFGAPPAHISSTIGRPLPLPGMPVGTYEAPNSTPLPGPAEVPGALPCLPAVRTYEAPHPGPLPGPAEVPGTLPYHPAMAMPVSDPTASGLPFAHASSCDSVSSYAAPATAGDDAPIFFSVVLQKGPAGFGIGLNHDNVVTQIKPGSEADRGGLIQRGDRVLELNGHAVTEDQTVKSFAIDVPEGATATFSFMREFPGPKRTSEREDAVAAHVEGTAAPLPPAPSAPSAGYPVLADALPPAPLEPPPPVPTPPPVPPLPLPPMPPSSTPVTATSNDEDDALARRLEMLKRGA